MRQVVTLGSRRVSYEETGPSNGRVLVLLHAFPLASAMWQPQMGALPAGVRAIAPDLAGFGTTDDGAPVPPRLDDYAMDVIALLDDLGIDRAVVGGLSLGGYVALALARLAPGRLAGLVLADTKAPSDTPEARAGRDRMLVTLAERGLEGVADEMLPKLLGETTRRQRPEVAHEMRALVLANPPGGVANAIQRLRDRPDARPVLPTITVPTLVLVGDEDTVTPLAEAEALQKSIRGAALEVIPGAGHLSNVEQPGAFTAALARWLEAL